MSQLTYNNNSNKNNDNIKINYNKLYFNILGIIYKLLSNNRKSKI